MFRKLFSRRRPRPFRCAPTCRPVLEELERRVVLFIPPRHPAYVVNLADGIPQSGAGAPQNPLSLVQAIAKVNADPIDPSGPVIINFDIRGQNPGPYFITPPVGGFPVINHPVIIDGASQAGYTATTPMIVLNGTRINDKTQGYVLDIEGGGSMIKGLVFRDPEKNTFGFKGILLHNGSGNTLEGNFIGTEPSGMSALTVDPSRFAAQVFGISISGSNDNIITGNLISGNETVGISIDASIGNQIGNNKIGTKINGMEALPNGSGIIVHNSMGTVIDFNVISGNSYTGIVFLGNSSGNLVRNNKIGTQKEGLGRLGNIIGVLITGTDNFNGILSDGKPNHNTIGGQIMEDFNLISGNITEGIQIKAGANHNDVAGNFIGTDNTGRDIFGFSNLEGGVLIDGSPNNTIGGAVGVLTNKAAGECNVIAGNSDFGVRITGPDARQNVVEGNFIGVDALDRGPLGDINLGIDIESASGNTIGGLMQTQANIIAGCNIGILIKGSGASDNLVVGNRIGTDFQNSEGLSNVVGVFINGASKNVIGNFRGSGNVISGNRQHGIYIQGYNATPNDPTMNASKLNIIRGNLVGTTNDGKHKLANKGTGVLIADASLNILGGTNVIDGVMGDTGNVISGNDVYGVQISGPNAQKNTVESNRIGIDVDGATAIPNGLENTDLGDGVRIDGASNNTIGGTSIRTSNVISGNWGAGVHIRGMDASGNLLRVNFIGTDGNGNNPQPNRLGGVWIHDAPGNTIGDSALAGYSNIIAGNRSEGIHISGAHATHNLVQSNQIGTNNDRMNLGNYYGISMRADASMNTIGAATQNGGNLIAGNSSDGIVIFGRGSTGNLIQHNLIGTTRDGRTALRNERGVVVLGASSNTIGGTGDLGRNVISGNGTGVEIFNSIDDSANQNVVQDAYIGTNLDGTAAIPNEVLGNEGGDGIVINGGQQNTIGGTTDGTRNVISGNPRNGIHIRGVESRGNLVQNCFVGTNRDGTGPIINGYSNVLANGIFIDGAPDNVIGSASAFNVISANAGFGISIDGSSAQRNLIDNNRIGLGFDGSTIIGGNKAGVVIFDGSHNHIGENVGNIISGNLGPGISLLSASDNAIQRNFIGTDRNGLIEKPNAVGVAIGVGSNDNTLLANLISGNKHAGVRINGQGIVSTQNILLRNFIGTQTGGSGRLPNGGDGVEIVGGATSNTIGGPASDGNVIRFNKGIGVNMEVGTRGNVVLGNVIDGNGDPSSNILIAQISSPTTNSFQVTSAFHASSHIEGMLHGAPNMTYTLEFFACTAPDSSGLGQGEEFLGSKQVTTGASGTADVRADFATSIAVGQFVTTTVTGPNEDTSGFSPALPVIPPPAPDELSIDDVTLAEGNSGSTAFVFTVTRRNFSDHVVTVQVDTADGTATAADGDYTPVHGLVMTFSPGGPLQQKVTVNVAGNLTVEPDEWFSVSLSNVTGGTIGKGIGKGTILNDDRTAFSVTDVALPEGESGTTAFAFTVSLSNPSDQPVSVQVDTTDGTASASGGDYTPITGRVLTFNPGDPLTQTVIVNVSGDTTVEPAETFALKLSNATGLNVSIARAVGTGTILNDNRTAFSVSDVTMSEGNSGSTAFAFTVSLSNPSEQPVSVQVDTADGTATTAEGDYTPITGRVLTFNPGDPLTQTVIVNVAADNSVEPADTFTLNLNNPTGRNVSIARPVGAGTILNDNRTTFSISDVALPEGNGGSTAFAFTVSLSNPSERPVTVQVDTADGTARAAESDYTPITGRVLTFNPGDPLTQTVTVLIAGNITVEPDETFTVSLNNPTGRNVSIARAAGAGTILNDDSTAFSINNVALPEGDKGLTPFVFTISLSNPSEQPVSVQVDTGEDPKGVNDNDYLPISGLILTFNPGAPLTQTVTVNVPGDLQPEPDETFTVLLSHAAGANVSIANAIGVLTIQDDDTDSDGDGIPDKIENAAPNGGDGNHDSIPDSQQANVASLPNAVDGQYVTLVSPGGTAFTSVVAVANPDPLHAPPGITFPVGFFNYFLTGLPAGGAATATMILPPGVKASGFYQYGRRSVTDSSPYFYLFPFNGTTGAEILTDRIVLHGVDGGAGDNDLTANGLFVDLGGPALVRGADLALAMSHTPDPVGAGRPITYTLTVTNKGPNDATGVTLTDTLPAGAAFVSAQASQGTSNMANGVVTYSLGSLANGVSATATLVVLAPSAPGIISNSATVVLNEGDLDRSNNTAKQDTLVAAVGIIRGQKFEDLNGNGKHDPGEPGLDGVAVQLVNPATQAVLQTTVTGPVDLNGDGTIDPVTERGLYSFAVLQPGTYVVQEAPAAGFVQTLPAGGSTTQRVSVSNTGIEGNNASSRPSISADGRFVAFVSSASNLVPGDSNGRPDVFVYDRVTGQIERVSVPDPNTGQTEANGGSFVPAISADGRFVAFQSFASNLVPGDTNREPDIFVHDRVTGATERVNIAADGTQGDRPSGPGIDFLGGAPAISADGRFVAFDSNASNLVPGDNNSATDVFVKDRQTGLLERVSVNSAGQETRGFRPSYAASISADGRYVAFTSNGDIFVPNDTNNAQDIFVKDRLTGAVERVSTDSFGGQSASLSRTDNSSISADGRFVAFQSTAANLVPGDTNGTADIFVKDRQTGVLERVSVDSNGNQAAGGTNLAGSVTPAISTDGRFVAFQSDAANLVPGDTNQMTDVFVHDRQTGQTVRISVDSSGNQASAFSGEPAISANGQAVAFDSTAANLVANDHNNVQDVFVHASAGSGSYQVTVALGQEQTGFDFGNRPTLSDVVISKTGPTGPVISGTNVTYMLSYRNLGVAPAQNVMVVDHLPAGLAFVSATTGGVFNAADGTETFVIGTLAANDGVPGGPDEGSATVTARVIATGGILTSSATISTTSPQSTTTNDSDSSTNSVIAADVALTKTGPVGPLLSGTDVTYTLGYRNLGTAAAQNVTLVDILPAGLSFVSASGGGSFDPGTGSATFSLGTLAANDGAPGGPDEGSATVMAHVTATGGTIINAATISTTSAESDTTNNHSTFAISVTAADVTVSDTGPAGPLVAGTYVTYALAYRNLGTAPAQNVALVDFVLAGLRFISAGPGGSFDPATGAVTFSLGSLAANDGVLGGPDEGSVNVLALVTATRGAVSNRATISTTTVESDTTNNASSISETIASADLTVSKTGPTGPVLSGTEITYALGYRNLGTAAAQDVQVVDTLPAGLSFVSASAGASFNPATREVTFNVGTLSADNVAPGGPDEGSATVTALVTATAGTLTNTATISTTTGESDTSNNRATLTTAVNAADVAVTQRGPAGALLFGTDVTYTLGYRNRGTAAAQNATLIDTLPAGLAFVAASAGGSFDAATDTVTFNLGTLVANSLDGASVTFTAHVIATAGTVTSVAVISTTTPESDTTNNRSALTSAVTSADVTVANSGPAGPLLSGTNVTYTLAYRNLGTAPAQNVTVVDTLPPGLTFVSASGGGSFDPATAAVTFSIGTLAANDGAAGGPDEGSVTVTAHVSATGGTVTDSAVISTTTPESDTTNNRSTMKSDVIAAEVTVDKGTPSGPLLAGTDVIFTLAYHNLGTAPAENTSLIATLPAGLTFLDASNDGSFDPVTGQVTFALGTLAAKGSTGGPNEGSVEVAAEVTATSGTLTNSAVISTTTAQSGSTNQRRSFVNTITAAVLTVNQTGPAGPLSSGTQVTYTLTYHNLGTAAARNVVLRDTLPAGLSFVSASGEAGFDPTTNTVDFLIGTLVPDQGGSVTVTALVTATSGSVTNTAAISTTTVQSDDTKSRNTLTNHVTEQMVGSANACFVNAVYQDLLGRPAEASGLAGWTGLMDKGMSRSELVQRIEGSLEYRTRLVDALYTTLLHRSADASGRDGFVALLGQSGTAEQVKAMIIGSTEYFQTRGRGSSAGFLDALYQDVLGRSIDAAGLAAWGPVENFFSHTTLADLVISSSEAHQRLVDSYYQRYLHRTAAANEVNAFVAYLDRGVQIMVSKRLFLADHESFDPVLRTNGQFSLMCIFLGSEEYRSKAMQNSGCSSNEIV